MISSLISIPIILTNAEKPPTRVHVIISGILATFPIKDYINKLESNSKDSTVENGTIFTFVNEVISDV